MSRLEWRRTLNIPITRQNGGLITQTLQAQIKSPTQARTFNLLGLACTGLTFPAVARNAQQQAQFSLRGASFTPNVASVVTQPSAARGKPTGQGAAWLAPIGSAQTASRLTV